LDKELDNFGFRTFTRASHPLHHGLHTQNSRALSREFNWKNCLLNHCLLI